MLFPRRKKKKLSLISLIGLSLVPFSFLTNKKKTQFSFAAIKEKATATDIDFAIEEIEREYFNLGGINHVFGVKLLHDFDDNEFVFAKFEKNGYGIFNVANADVVELSPFGVVPFDWYCSDVRYIPWIGFYEKQNGFYINNKSKRILGIEEASELKQISNSFIKQSIIDANDEAVALKKAPLRKSGNPSTNYDFKNGLIYADHEVPHSWYFKRNNEEFPKNKNNTCSYVAASMLLAYAELFECTGYFSKEEAAKYIIPYRGNRSFEHGEYTFDGVPDLIDGFPQKVWGEDIGDVGPATIDKEIHAFLRDAKKDVKYHNYYYLWELASITKPINDGFPAAYFGMQTDPNDGTAVSHTTVVYGYYDNGNVLCHFGWEGYTQVVMSKLGIFSQGGVVAIYNESDHRHNEYFIDKFSGKKYCGCGELMSC